MGAFFRKKRSLELTTIGKLSLIGAMTALSLAFVDTIWAVYIDSFVNSMVLVGFIFSFLTLVSFTSFFLIVPIIEKYSKSKLYYLSLFFFGIIYLLLAFTRNFYLFIVLAVAVTILFTLRVICYGIIVRDKSSERQLSRNEGLSYTLINVAWLTGPLIAGYVSDIYGVSLVFLLAAIFIFIALTFFKFSKIEDVNLKRRADKKVFRNFREFFKSKDRTFSYVLSGGVNLWWVLIYIFMPLYIMRQGLGIRWVGYFLFAVPIPLVLFQYYFSRLAGKVGFKKLFKIGFFIPFVLAVICFFMTDVYIIMLLLVLASLGLAMTESTTEAYFFDLLKGKQELRFYGPYNTTIDLNHFIGNLSASILFLFLPFKYVFILYGFFMLIMFLVSFKVRNIVERRRDGKLN